MISYNSKFTFGKKYILNILAERFGSDPAKPEEKIGEKAQRCKNTYSPSNPFIKAQEILRT